MKSFEIREFGIAGLTIVDGPKPKPAANGVLVRMRAVALNYRDLLVVEGKYNPNLKRPLVPCSDGTGIVEAVGPAVTRWKPGDRVAGIFMQSWLDGGPSPEKGKSALGGAINGVLQEWMHFHEDGLVPVPTHLSDIEAATLPCAAVTSWNALFEGGMAYPGETVLLQGTGGVSTFGLLFAKAAGLRVIITSSSDEKIARAKQLGAHEAVNYKTTPQWDGAARELTNGLGVDKVLEVGGSGTFPMSLKAVRTGGKVSVIGNLSGVEPSVTPGAILMNSVHVQGIYVGSRAMFERMNRAMILHQIRPIIDKVFEWTDYPEALKYMKSASHFGKICLHF